MSQSVLIKLVALALTLAFVSQQLEASGVFELELINFKQLDAKGALASEPKQDSENLIRLVVCLKEAFTSQLDGPCTFGNSSLTLNRDSIERNETSGSASQEAQKQSGSQLTNLVRILFTFRWMKSFTILVTGEELQLESDNLKAQRLVEEATNGTNLVDPALVNKKLLTKEPTASNAFDKFTGKLNFIDRHVLTENEVLPDRETNSNKPWTERYSRSLKSSLAYRFRVYCSLNYFGDGCTTFCRPRDDQFGHYNCSSTGQKICLDGWDGADCDKAKCRSGCNQQHGYCDKPDTCQCRPGWSGSRCDECITYPGCRNGYCLSPWQCICQLNWGGVLCDRDLNYCGTHDPCKNNGTCQNVAPGKYKCNCPANFTGLDCDVNLNNLPAATGPLDLINLNDSTSPELALEELSSGPYIENIQVTTTHVVDMKHLISGVVVASIIGVFLASLLLAWCCLMAIKRHGFSFIQMNIIRDEDGRENGSSAEYPPLTSTLRRMHDKIRDSFRRTTGSRIKPKTKLSLDNVLRPPPSYEESSYQYINRISMESGVLNQKSAPTPNSDITQITTKESQYSEENFNQKLSQHPDNKPINVIGKVNQNCPRHGHLYRQKTSNDCHPHDRHNNKIVADPDKTVITITGPIKTYPHQQTSHLYH